MDSINKILFGLLLFLSNNCAFGQDIKEATINYFTKDPHSYNHNNYNRYDKNIISDAKIKAIEEHQYTYINDTIYSDIISEKFIFNIKGNVEYTFYKNSIASEKEYYFKYDSIGNLIKKETYGYSPEGKYKNIESFVWTYNKYGFLTRQRRYLTANSIGGSGFPEENILFSNEDIVYNLDTTTTIVLNNIEHCKDDSINRVHPDHFKYVFYTTLKFHSNNKLHVRTVSKGDTLIQSYVYNKCGVRTEERKPNSKCLKLFPDRTKCLTPEKIRICNELDTVTFNNQLAYFVRNENSFFQPDSGPGTQFSTKSIAYYDLDLKTIHSVDSTIAKRGSMRDLNYFKENKTVRIKSYEYLDNGLLKKIITKNENGIVINVVNYKIEYYN